MSKVKRLSQTGTTCRTVVTVEKLHSKEQVALTLKHASVKEGMLVLVGE